MIYITGDTHADFNRLGAKHFKAADGDYLIVCGDFGGVWNGSKSEKHWHKWLSERPFTTLFVSGNHENYDMLADYPVSEWNGGTVQFITDRVIHLMRGQVYTIEGKTFFTMGGASSHDIDDGILEPDDPDFTINRKKLDMRQGMYRINHVSWWAQELPSLAELDEGVTCLERYGWSVDYIVTHCAPTSVVDVIGRGFYKRDILTDYLETVYRKCSFKEWYFGHYHEDKRIGEKLFLLYNHIVCLDSDI